MGSLMSHLCVPSWLGKTVWADETMKGNKGKELRGFFGQQRLGSRCWAFYARL